MNELQKINDVISYLKTFMKSQKEIENIKDISKRTYQIEKNFLICKIP